MATLAVSVEQNVEKTVRKVALVVDSVVVLATPVDTGRARSNWTVTLDNAAEGVREPYSPGEGLGTGEGANAQAALNQGMATVAQYRSSNNSSIHIANNLPYIERLNDGSSAQAPAGFVQKAVQQGSAVVNGTKVVGN
jgi:hypothetical protein